MSFFLCFSLCWEDPAAVLGEFLFIDKSAKVTSSTVEWKLAQ